jgi:hypothetical protein
LTFSSFTLNFRNKTLCIEVNYETNHSEGAREHLWFELIKKHDEDNVQVLVNTLAYLAEGKKRIKKQKPKGANNG